MAAAATPLSARSAPRASSGRRATVNFIVRNAKPLVKGVRMMLHAGSKCSTAECSFDGAHMPFYRQHEEKLSQSLSLSPSRTGAINNLSGMAYDNMTLKSAIPIK